MPSTIRLHLRSLAELSLHALPSQSSTSPVVCLLFCAPGGRRRGLASPEDCPRSHPAQEDQGTVGAVLAAPPSASLLASLVCFAQAVSLVLRLYFLLVCT